ncbi:MAG TPA: hypothetical protein VK797_27700 [Tepidisphaeraceae bacterium]|jgi:hypothetical protein|nr:hypothetical protein [Tepidisphaeraceae bacterium]
MSLQLSQEDQRAVDLLLDRVATAKGNGNGNGQDVQLIYAASDPSLGERTARVQRLLHLLDALPAPEVPAGLADRTMELVDRAERSQNIAPDLQSLLSSHRPVA